MFFWLDLLPLQAFYLVLPRNLVLRSWWYFVRVFINLGCHLLTVMIFLQKRHMCMLSTCSCLALCKSLHIKVTNVMSMKLVCWSNGHVSYDPLYFLTQSTCSHCWGSKLRHVRVTFCISSIENEVNDAGKMHWWVWITLSLMHLSLNYLT